MPQPAHAQREAQEGNCYTPEHQAPFGRPKTPDTANLLQRALASSGSALISSLSQVSSDPQPCQGVPSVSAEAPGMTVLATAVTAAVHSSGPQPVTRHFRPVPGTAQQNTLGFAVIPNSASEMVPGPVKLAAAVSADHSSAAETAIASTAVRDLHRASSTASELSDAQAGVSYHPAQQAAASRAGAGHFTASAQQDSQVTQQMAVSSSGTADQQHGTVRQVRQVGEALLNVQAGQDQAEQAMQKGALQQQLATGLDQAERHHARAGSGVTRAEAGANLAGSAGHVTAEVQPHLARQL